MILLIVRFLEQLMSLEFFIRRAEVFHKIVHLETNIIKTDRAHDRILSDFRNRFIVIGSRKFYRVVFATQTQTAPVILKFGRHAYMRPQMEAEFEKFDAVVGKVFLVPRAEILKREKEYQKKRKRIREKRAKTSPASHASNVRFSVSEFRCEEDQNEKNDEGLPRKLRTQPLSLSIWAYWRGALRTSLCRFPRYGFVALLFSLAANVAYLSCGSIYKWGCFTCDNRF